MASIAPSDTASSNVQKMHGFVRELQQEKRIDLFDTYIDPEFVDHQLTGGTTDAESARQFMTALHASVDELNIEIIDCIGQGDIVATHKVFRGRIVQDFLGFAKGESLNLRVMDFMRMRNGRAVEHWATNNALSSASPTTS